MDRQAQRDIRRKLNCLQFPQECGSNVLACRKFGVSKSLFYRWKAGYREKGEAGLINSLRNSFNFLHQIDNQNLCPMFKGQD